MTTTVELQVPLVDDERIQDTYTELKGMQVQLDPNPIEYGPRRFNNRIAQVRAMLNRVEQLSLQASEDLHYFKRIINAKKSLYELEKRELMVKDPTCRVGRSQGEREAIADVRLRSQIESIQELEAAAHDLETIMLSIRSKRTDLKDAQSRMRDQMKLIEHDISMGARWGNRDVVSPNAVASGSTDDLDNMLDNVDAALGWSGEDVPPEPIVGLGTVEEEEEEDEEEALVVATPAPKPLKSSPRATPRLEPVLVLVPTALAVPDAIEEEMGDPLEAAFTGSGTSKQFGDGELATMSDVNSFFSSGAEMIVDAVLVDSGISPNDGIDDLIASLVND
jgi:hypothetical protein